MCIRDSAGAKLASAGVRLFDAKTLVLVGTCAGRAAKGVKCGDVAIPAALSLIHISEPTRPY